MKTGSGVERALDIPEETVVGEILRGSQTDLLYYASVAMPPELVARNLLDYCSRTTRFRYGLVIFRDGYRLCSSRFPLKEILLNERYSDPGYRAQCGRWFDSLSTSAIIADAKEGLSGIMRNLIGDEVLALDGSFLIARISSKNYRAIGLVVAFGEAGIDFLDDEKIFLKSVAETIACKIRALVAQYFGEDYPHSGLGYKYPFVEGRRKVVALFCDVRNFTPLTSLFPGRPEINAGLQNFSELASRAIFSRGGMLDKFMGDGIMALFGVTSETRSDVSLAAQNACEVALDFLSLFSDAREKYFDSLLAERSEFIDLQVGIGIDAGDALLGFFGGGNIRSYSAIGDAINTAARLEGQAGKESQKGDRTMSNVIVGNTAYRLLPEDFKSRCFEKEPVNLQVKGKSLPIRVHEMKIPETRTRE
jgi:class 3 adenylate cyclase